MQAVEPSFTPISREGGVSGMLLKQTRCPIAKAKRIGKTYALEVSNFSNMSFAASSTSAHLKWILFSIADCPNKEIYISLVAYFLENLQAVTDYCQLVNC